MNAEALWKSNTKNDTIVADILALILDSTYIWNWEMPSSVALKDNAFIHKIKAVDSLVVCKTCGNPTVVYSRID